MRPISRRELAERIASLLPTYAFLHHALRRDLFAAPYRVEGDRWLARVHDASRDLTGPRLTPVQWQSEVGGLFGGADLADLVRLVDFDRLSRQIERPADRAAARAVTLPEVEGLPRPPAFGTKVFALRKVVDNLDPTMGFRYEMDFVDPAGGEPVGGGRIRSRRLSFEQALSLYGPRRS